MPKWMREWVMRLIVAYAVVVSLFLVTGLMLLVWIKVWSS